MSSGVTGKCSDVHVEYYGMQMMLYMAGDCTIFSPAATLNNHPCQRGFCLCTVGSPDVATRGLQTWLRGAIVPRSGIGSSSHLLRQLEAARQVLDSLQQPTLAPCPSVLLRRKQCT